MKDVNDLSNRQKARVITLFIISILLFFNATGYVSGIVDAGHQIDYMEDMNVDGSDFSPIANLFILGTNGILQFLTGLLAAAAMIILSYTPCSMAAGCYTKKLRNFKKRTAYR